MGQIGGSLHLLAVEDENDVPHLNPAGLRRAVLFYKGDQCSGGLIQAERLCQVLIDILDADPETTASHPATVLELLGNIQHQADRDSKGQANRTAAAGIDLGVDTDHLTLHIEQGAAGVSRINRHIGLDKRHVVLIAFIGKTAADGADNTSRHGIIQAEGRADGQHPFAHFQRSGFGQFDRGQRLRLEF